MLTAEDILDAVVSHAQTLGVFERVNQHEPKNAPGYGMTAAVWLDRVDTSRLSGLDQVSVRLAFKLRIYTNMLQEPQDMIDPNVLQAVDLLMTAYCNDFTLGGLVRCVDLMGMAGAPLSMQAGYLDQDGKVFRIVDISLPLLVNDVWEESE